MQQAHQPNSSGGESPPLSASVIASRRYNRHSRVGEPVIGPLVESYRIATNIAVRHERHGDGVWPDHHRIVQGCQQVTIARDVPGVRDNLRDNELSLRRSAPICFAAGGGKASHTSAMHVPRIAFTVMLVTGQYVRVAVGIVIDEGDLIADPRAPLPAPRLAVRDVMSVWVRRSDVLSIEPEKAPCEVSRPVSITSMTSPCPC